MHPLLFTFAGYQVTSYGVALVLAFAVGIRLAERRARARGLDEARVTEAGMIAIVSSLVGSRLLWVVTHPEAFQPPRGTWADAFNPLRSDGGIGIAGLSMMGGVALALVCCVGYLHWKKVPALRFADVIVPSVALGEGITRIGCLLNGCCHGLVCDLPWALRFPPGSGPDAVFPGQALHPTQIYASLAGFAVFSVLSVMLARRRWDGFVFYWFLVLMGGQRILVDLFRYYESQVTLLGSGSLSLTVNHLFSVSLVAVGILGLLFHPREVATTPAAPA